MRGVDKEFMARALNLARLGVGNVFPNPMVGCVIVAQNKIIGEGYHAFYGGPHAEVNAIRSVKKNELLPESTLYVSLEPCNHTGKTPPCTDLIVKSKIPRVVIAVKDPDQRVSGAGISFLEEAGISVSCGVLEKEARFLNRRFFTYHQQERPYVILKWAESADGFIAAPFLNDTSASMPISNVLSRQISHRWRTIEPAILIGAQTAINDNPILSPRLWPGKPPLRILFDSSLRVPSDSILLSDGLPTVVFNRVKDTIDNGVEYIKVDENTNLIPLMLDILYNRKIMSVLVEGGTETISRFVEEGCWDEIRRFRSPVLLGVGVKAPQISGCLETMSDSSGDMLEYWLNPDAKAYPKVNL